jgi:hypothetical protein
MDQALAGVVTPGEQAADEESAGCDLKIARDGLSAYTKAGGKARSI